VLGGHTSARLGANLRTRHGFAYFVECSIQRRRLASQVVIAAGVSTSVTARALVELRYELARLGTEPVPPAELEAARRHVCGRLSLAVQTRAGLANQLAGLDAAGLDAATLPRLATAVASTTAEDVLVAARRYFAPRRLVTVLVGDATVVQPALDGLDDVEVLTSV
jgi:predicted Zn-dependent peptidase